MIETMTFVEVVGLKKLLGEVAPLLQELGVLHLRSVDINRRDLPPSFLHRVSYSEAQRAENAQLTEIQKILRSLKVVTSKIGHPEGASELAAKWAKVPTVEVYREISRVRRKIQAFLRKKGNVRDERVELEREMKTLRQLKKELRLHAEWSAPDAVAIALPDARRSLRPKLDEFLRRSSLDLVGSCTLPNNAEMLVVKCGEDLRPELDGFLRRERLKVYEIPGHAHLPLNEAVDQAIERFEKLPGIHKRLDRELDAFVDHEKALIRSVEMFVSTKQALYKNLHHIAQSEYLFVIEGWVPSDTLENFKTRLRGRFGTKVCVNAVAKPKVKRREIPVKLTNPSWLKPYEIFLSLFPAPVYGSIDPTPLIAVGFPLFFGFILGDSGYGLIIMALALWLRSRAQTKGQPLFADAATIALTCGVSTFLFGLLYGEFFGDPSPIFHAEIGLIPWTWPHFWHQRHADFLKILLGISIAAGGIHITLSLILGAILNFRDGDKKHGYERVGFLMFFLGVVALLPQARPYLPGLGDVAYFWLGWGLLGGGLGLLLVKVGIAGLLESVSLLANVVSYSRLMAIGVASIVLANVANSLLSPPIGVFEVLGAGLIHFVNICLGILSPAIHSMRLHFVEFLPKFQKGGGNRYQPFAIQEITA